MLLSYLSFEQWLPLSVIKSAFPLSKGNLRTYLRNLLELKLVLMETQTSAAHLYRLAPHVQALSRTTDTYLQPQDIEEFGDLELAAMMYHFRLLYANDCKSLIISTREINQTLHFSSNIETTRNKLIKIQQHGYISRNYASRNILGGVSGGCISALTLSDKLLNIELQRVVQLLPVTSPNLSFLAFQECNNNQPKPESAPTKPTKSYTKAKKILLPPEAKELAALFAQYKQLYFKYEVPQNTLKSWHKAFRAMLETNSHDDIRFTLACLPKSSKHKQIRHPNQFGSIFQELYTEAKATFTDEEAAAYLYKLQHNVAIDEESYDSQQISLLFQEWCQRLGIRYLSKGSLARSGRLYHWWRMSSHGVTDVDVEDYISQAQLLMLNFYTNPPSKKSREHPDRWLRYKLSDYMLEHRHVDKSAKNDLNSHISIDGSIGRNIMIVDMEDLESFAVTIDDEEYESTEEYSSLHDALNDLSERDRNILMDYFGFDGHSMDMTELAEKYSLSVSGISFLIKKSKARLAELLQQQEVN